MSITRGSAAAPSPTVATSNKNKKSVAPPNHQPKHSQSSHHQNDLDHLTKSLEDIFGKSENEILIYGHTKISPLSRKAMESVLHGFLVHSAMRKFARQNERQQWEGSRVRRLILNGLSSPAEAGISEERAQRILAGEETANGGIIEGTKAKRKPKKAKKTASSYNESPSAAQLHRHGSIREENEDDTYEEDFFADDEQRTTRSPTLADAAAFKQQQEPLKNFVPPKLHLFRLPNGQIPMLGPTQKPDTSMPLDLPRNFRPRTRPESPFECTLRQANTNSMPLNAWFPFIDAQVKSVTPISLK